MRVGYEELIAIARLVLLHKFRLVGSLSKLCIACVCGFGMIACSSNNIEVLLSANQDTRVKKLVLHYTTVNFAESVEALVEEGGLSAHYLIPEQGDPSYPHSELKIFQLVEEHARAWHAGVSEWQNRQGLNDQSIGIELVNIPLCSPAYFKSVPLIETNAREECIFPDFDSQQINLTIVLIKQILERNPDIHPTAIVGHSDIAPQRKTDPGPKFPWYQLYQSGIGAWYEEETLEKYKQMFAQKLPSVELMQTALNAYGYAFIDSGEIDPPTQDTISAFQMHFMPHHINGEITLETAATLFALLERYFPQANETLLFSYYQQDYVGEE